MARFLKASRREVATPWRSAVGRWHEALQEGAQVVSSATDPLRKNMVGPRLRKHIYMIGDH